MSRFSYYHYGIDKRIDKKIDQEIINTLTKQNPNYNIIVNAKPFNLSNFYNTLDDKLKKFLIQSFTCLDSNVEIPKYPYMYDYIPLSVCTKINELRHKYFTGHQNEEIEEIMKISNNYTNIYSWLDSLNIQDLYKYINLPEILKCIDITFDDNYFVKKLIVNGINKPLENNIEIVKCVNNGLIEFCIKYNSDNMKIFVEYMMNCIYNEAIGDIFLKRDIYYPESIFNLDLFNILDHKRFDKYNLFKYYLDKFEKCYNYLRKNDF